MITEWQSTAAEIKNGNELHYSYILNRYDGNGKFLKQDNGTAILKIFVKTNGDVTLAEEFINPEKEGGVCEYKKIERRRYYNEKKRFYAGIKERNYEHSAS